MPSRHTDISNSQSLSAEPAARKSPPWFLVGLIAVYFVLAAAYNKLIPFENGPEASAAIGAQHLPVNPDEAAHVANAAVYKSGHLPVFRVGSPDFEAHQPPLYYVLIAPLLAPADASGDEPAIAARWLSILIGAALIICVWGATLELFPQRRSIADTAACICLLPTNVNVCASISNDVLTNTVVAAAVWQLTRAIRLADEPKARNARSLLLGCLLAVGIFTKTSTLVLFPAVIVAGWLLSRQGIIRARDAFTMVAISCVAGLVLASPWLIRNTRLYGDPLAQHIFNSAFTGTTATAQRMLTIVTPTQYFGWVASWSFDSFWAVFDGMRLFLPMSIYYELAGVVVLQAIGTIRWLRREFISPKQSVALWAMAIVALATIVAFARFNMSFFQAQGRYLYPGLTFLGLVLALGTLGWMRPAKGSDSGDLIVARDETLLPYAALAALLILNALSLYTLYCAFPPADQ